MSSDRSLVQREMQRVELRPFTVEGFHRQRERKQRNKRVRAGVVALIVAAVGMGALLRPFSSGLVPADDPRRAFLGTWVTDDTDDTDGSRPTMTIGTSGDEQVEIEVVDDIATVCSGAPSTMTGSGRLVGEVELVVASPVLTCDDGSEPQALNGPPLEEQLRDLTFVHDPDDDVLIDTFGAVWTREAAEEPAPGPAASGGMWPQSSMEEVRRAQKRADAGDPNFTWQVDAELASFADGVGDTPWGAEIFDRFVREELGWKESRNYAIRGYYDGGGRVGAVLYIRCVPGRTNPLYPEPYAQMPRVVRGCAPTIDDYRYETVRFHVEQPVRVGPSGIWVVTGWKIDRRQLEQVAPPSNAEATAFLRAFLGARIAGEGAEQYLRPPEGEAPSPDEEVPLLYATTDGIPYERYEIERLQGPVWPNGWIEFEVRLFAEDGAMVEQSFVVVRRDGRLELVYGPRTGPVRNSTTENGEIVPVPYSFPNGEVTFAAVASWYNTTLERSFASFTHIGGPSSGYDIYFSIKSDPLTARGGCETGPAPADAEALVRSIRSNPDLEATAPLAASVGGIDALQMDVVAPGRIDVGDCMPSVVEGSWPLYSPDNRMRVYVLDLPEGMSARTLFIAIQGMDADFEHVVKVASPVLNSIEFHSG